MKIAVFSLLAVFGGASAALAQTTAWTVRLEDRVLCIVDLTNGQITPIGPLNQFFTYGDLTYDWTRNTLYGLDYASGQFYTIDTATGNATLVGFTFREGLLTGLAFDPVSDKLFAGAEIGSYEIDRATGLATLLDASAARLDGLTYDPVRDTIVGADRDGRFSTLDRNTGQTALLSNGSGWLNDHDLVYSTDLNRFFAFGADGLLWSYDPVTFQRTLIGDDPGNFDGLAAVPEPTTLIGLGLGALALAARRRRR